MLLSARRLARSLQLLSSSSSSTSVHRIGQVGGSEQVGRRWIGSDSNPPQESERDVVVEIFDHPPSEEPSIPTDPSPQEGQESSPSEPRRRPPPPSSSSPPPFPSCPPPDFGSPPSSSPQPSPRTSSSPSHPSFLGDPPSISAGSASFDPINLDSNPSSSSSPSRHRPTISLPSWTRSSRARSPSATASRPSRPSALPSTTLSFPKDDDPTLFHPPPPLQPIISSALPSFLLNSIVEPHEEVEDEVAGILTGLEGPSALLQLWLVGEETGGSSKMEEKREERKARVEVETHRLSSSTRAPPPPRNHLSPINHPLLRLAPSSQTSHLPSSRRPSLPSFLSASPKPKPGSPPVARPTRIVTPSSTPRRTQASKETEEEPREPKSKPSTPTGLSRPESSRNRSIERDLQQEEEMTKFHARKVAEKEARKAAKAAKIQEDEDAWTQPEEVEEDSMELKLKKSRPSGLSRVESSWEWSIEGEEEEEEEVVSKPLRTKKKAVEKEVQKIVKAVRVEEVEVPWTESVPLPPKQVEVRAPPPPKVRVASSEQVPSPTKPIGARTSPPPKAEGKKEKARMDAKVQKDIREALQVKEEENAAASTEIFESQTTPPPPPRSIPAPFSSSLPSSKAPPSPPPAPVPTSSPTSPTSKSKRPAVAQKKKAVGKTTSKQPKPIEVASSSLPSLPSPPPPPPTRPSFLSPAPSPSILPPPSRSPIRSLPSSSTTSSGLEIKAQPKRPRIVPAFSQASSERTKKIASTTTEESKLKEVASSSSPSVPSPPPPPPILPPFLSPTSLPSVLPSPSRSPAKSLPSSPTTSPRLDIQVQSKGPRAVPAFPQASSKRRKEVASSSSMASPPPPPSTRLFLSPSSLPSALPPPPRSSSQPSKRLQVVKRNTIDPAKSAISLLFEEFSRTKDEEEATRSKEGKEVVIEEVQDPTFSSMPKESVSWVRKDKSRGSPSPPRPLVGYAFLSSPRPLPEPAPSHGPKPSVIARPTLPLPQPRLEKEVEQDQQEVRPASSLLVEETSWSKVPEEKEKEEVVSSKQDHQEQVASTPSPRALPTSSPPSPPHALAPFSSFPGPLQSPPLQPLPSPPPLPRMQAIVRPVEAVEHGPRPPSAISLLLKAFAASKALEKSKLESEVKAASTPIPPPHLDAFEPPPPPSKPSPLSFALPAHPFSSVPRSPPPLFLFASRKVPPPEQAQSTTTKLEPKTPLPPHLGIFNTPKPPSFLSAPAVVPKKITPSPPKLPIAPSKVQTRSPSKIEPPRSSLAALFTRFSPKPVTPPPPPPPPPAISKPAPATPSAPFLSSSLPSPQPTPSPSSKPKASRPKKVVAVEPTPPVSSSSLSSLFNAFVPTSKEEPVKVQQQQVEKKTTTTESEKRSAPPAPPPRFLLHVSATPPPTARPPPPPPPSFPGSVPQGRFPSAPLSFHRPNAEDGRRETRLSTPRSSSREEGQGGMKEMPFGFESQSGSGSGGERKWHMPSDY